MAEKVDKLEQKHREEHQNLVKMYEGSDRYKDVRQLYESNLSAKDSELMSAKEQLMQAKIQTESRERETSQKLLEADQKLKE